MERTSARKIRKAAAQKIICERLMEGESLRSIVCAEGMPGRSTVHRWLADDTEFRDQYARARAIQADTLFDEMLDIADDGSNDWIERRREDGSTETVLDHEHVQRSKLRVDTRKWMASKLAPKKYGDDLMLRHADADGGPLDLNDEARAVRLASIFDSIRRRRAGKPDDGDDDAI